MNENYKYEVLGDAITVDRNIEGHSLVKKGEAYVSLAASEKDTIRNAIIDAENWLPMAAEKYNISANLEDYIIVPCPLMNNDLPNKNGIGFPLEQLASFNPEMGKLAFQTWKGKPTFVEHNNKDYTKAKGVILEAAMRKVPNVKGPLFGVYALLAFDRNRDQGLADLILSKKQNSYSMGAWCTDYVCSICGHSLNRGINCEHIELNKPQTMRKFGAKLSYLQAINPVGFETSAVASPAYEVARNDFLMTLK